MRVITGEARGKNLVTLSGGDITRPTSQRVKEGMFSALQFYIAGARCLDLFSGSGQLGVEALSRGAALCVFVDASREAVSVTQQNLKSTGLYDRSRVITSEAISFARGCREKFDIVFIDPPYKSGLYEKALEAVAPLMNEGGMVMVELDKKTELPERIGSLAVSKKYRYSNTSVWLYRPAVEDAEGGGVR